MSIATDLKVFVLLVSIVCATQACSPRVMIPYSRTGRVEYVESADNTLTVRSQSFATTKEMAIRYAERNALENILFRGIPGSPQESPLVPDEQAARQSHGEMLTKMTAGGNYQQFVIQSYVDHVETSPQGAHIDQTVTFDLNALRKHLEREGVIRKFGL